MRTNFIITKRDHNMIKQHNINNNNNAIIHSKELLKF